jgi:hypothetical protein
VEGMKERITEAYVTAVTATDKWGKPNKSANRMLSTLSNITVQAMVTEEKISVEI